MRTRMLWNTWLVLGIVLLVACGSSDKSRPPCAEEGGCATMDASGGPMAESLTVRGRVFDADSARGLAMAKVSAAQGATATSEREGDFVLMSKDALSVLQISRTDYASTRKSSPSAGGFMEVFIKRLGRVVRRPEPERDPIDGGAHWHRNVA